MSDMVIISKNDLRELMANTRQDIRKKICSARDAMRILDMGTNTFQNHVKKIECLIRPSSLRGKYVLQSVYDEADRLNGEHA